MDDRETLLVCYRSGQISAAQWERHCEDDPELRKMTEAPKVDRPICTADEPAAPPKHDHDAAAPSRQSAGVEAMARELAADFLIRNSTESEMLSALLSFAARVAADQRERDAKIAETPDPQLANKTAAQIAAAIRASAKPF